MNNDTLTIIPGTPMPDLSKYKPEICGLVYLTEDDPDSEQKRITFHQCDLFSDTETKEIEKSANVLSRFFTNLDRLDGIRDSYKEFKDELKNLNENNPKSKVTADRRFRAFILEWKLFIDHFSLFIENGAQTEYWIDANDEEKKEYLAAFRQYFDDLKRPSSQTESFNLAAVIRNHVQHAYDAVDQTDWKTVYISRDKILKGRRVNEYQKVALVKQPEFIDLSVVADEGLKAIEKLHEDLMNFMIDDEVANAALVLIKAKQKIDDSGIASDNWMICEFGPMRWVKSETEFATLTRVADENGNLIDHPEGIILPRLVPETVLSYTALNWPAYESFAKLLAKLYQEGVWRDIREKYFNQGR